MKNPIVTLGRAISERRSRSTVPTGFTALSKISKAVVFIDACEKSAPECLAAIKSFFEARKMDFEVLAFNLGDNCCLNAEDGATLVLRRKIRWFGKVRLYHNDEQLFIDLTDGSLYPSRNSAVRSKALFKVARWQYKGIIDLEICGSEGHSQAEVFNTVANIIIKVQ